MISVIVPVYNASKYLRECIDSILAQTVQGFELILINDGSSDDSLEICQSYETDKRVVVLSHANHGVSFTRNQGLDVAKGEFVTFVDSDDTIPENAFETLLGNVQTHNADLVKGDYYFNYAGKIMPHATRLPKGIYKKDEILPNLIDDGRLSGFLISSTCCVLYRKSIIDVYQIRFNVGLKNNEDGLFNYNYILHIENPIVETGVCVYYVRKHGENNSAKRKIDYDFNLILKDAIYALGVDDEKYQIELQFRRRNVTLAMWDIMLFSSRLKIKEALTFIRSRVKDVKEDVKYIKPEQLNRYKKIMFYLIKYRKPLLLFVVSKYVIPFLSSKVSR